jgi:dipeptidyl aminopeptidase/acylaminoacyl peptidase
MSSVILIGKHRIPKKLLKYILMKTLLRFLLIILIAGGAGYLGFLVGTKSGSKDLPEAIKKIVPTPLTKYTIDSLAERKPEIGEIKIEDLINKAKSFESFAFSLDFDPTLNGEERKKVTGMINLPEGENLPAQAGLPLILMIRGYVDQSIYQTGSGTQRAGEVFAENGFITVAPDFLGYGGSDTEAGNIFESRFQTYTTVLSVLASIPSITKWDKKNIFIWAHSNGGQIALTTLAVSRADFPTVLWAPVTKPFPYSVLYYTDESEDKGKFIRKELARFEEIYDVEKYDFNNYLTNILAPIQIHQGTADDAVPYEWSREFFNILKKYNPASELFIYEGSDHNLMPAWNEVVNKNLEFFNKNLKQ